MQTWHTYCLIFPFAPPGVADQWGCGSTASTQLGTTAENGHGGEERLRVFGEVAESQARLDCAIIGAILSPGLTRMRAIQNYFAHCAISTRGLSSLWKVSRDEGWQCERLAQLRNML
jgi:hypothetical protein